MLYSNFTKLSRLERIESILSIFDKQYKNSLQKLSEKNKEIDKRVIGTGNHKSYLVNLEKLFCFLFLPLQIIILRISQSLPGSIRFYLLPWFLNHLKIWWAPTRPTENWLPNIFSSEFIFFDNIDFFGILWKRWRERRLIVSQQLKHRSSFSWGMVFDPWEICNQRNKRHEYDIWWIWKR